MQTPKMKLLKRYVRRGLDVSNILKHQIEPLIRILMRKGVYQNMRSKKERRYLSLLVKRSKLGLMEVDAESRLRQIKMAQNEVAEELEELKKQGISLNTIR